MKFFETIGELNKKYNIESKYPLIDVQKFSEKTPPEKINFELATLGFYKILFIKNFNGIIQTGKITVNSTDESGSFYFVLPGESYLCKTDKSPSGYQIHIHQDIFQNYLTEKDINDYNFFSYDVHGELTLSKKEKKATEFLMNRIWEEFSSTDDEFTLPILMSYISVLLHHFERFYSRQFKRHKKMCNQLVSNFFLLLKTYYSNGYSPPEPPSVFLFSKKLNVSPNYLGDSVKYYTGVSALNIIHDFIIDEAKMLLKTSDKSVSEISYMLGYEYPNYFSRLFKKKTGISPSDYKKSIRSN